MKKRIVSGITATGSLTIGNYLGAIKNFVKHQDDYEMFIFVADLHALTTNINPEELNNNRQDIFALYLACGLDYKKTTIFFQSDVPAHTFFNWITITHTNMGELQRMTQFKDKSLKIKNSNGTEEVPVGLFIYPTLMAADILLYNPDFVPVGTDQKQHLEFTKNLAIKLNKKYKLNLKQPKPLFSEIGSKIMSLKNPEVKMSKSDTDKNASIFLLDDPEVAFNKIQKAVTDSENKIYYSDEKPGIKNLLIIYASLKNKSIEETCLLFKDYNYKEFKKTVGNEVKEFLTSIQINYINIRKNLSEISQDGALKANKIANENLHNLLQTIGLKSN